MIWVRTMPASMVDLNFNLPSWLGWMKSLLATMNWILSAITFSMSLPSVLRRTMGRNAFSWSYDDLLGLCMITVDETLKYFGQYPKLMHESAMLIMFERQVSWLTMNFKCRHVSLSGPSTDPLLHLLIANLNSSLENGLHHCEGLCSISLSMSISTWQFRAVLKVLWRVFHKLSGERHGWPLWLTASMAGSFYLLIQFISSHGPWFLFSISWILSSKKDLLMSLTTFLNFFQFSRFLNAL